MNIQNKIKIKRILASHSETQIILKITRSLLKKYLKKWSFINKMYPKSRIPSKKKKCSFANEYIKIANCIV